MTQWEYCLVCERWETLPNFAGQAKAIREITISVMGSGKSDTADNVYLVYNDLGQNGWELVSIVNNEFEQFSITEHYFKRPIRSKP